MPPKAEDPKFPVGDKLTPASKDGDIADPTGTVKTDEQSPDGGAGKYDGGYADPKEPTKAEDPEKGDEGKTDDSADGEEDNFEECTCAKCGSTYKSKKVEKEELAPSANNIEWGQNYLDIHRPEKVATSIDLDAIFGRPKMVTPSFKAQIDNLIMNQLGGMTDKKVGAETLEESVMKNLPVPSKK